MALRRAWGRTDFDSARFVSTSGSGDVACLARSQARTTAGATDENSTAVVELDRDAPCREHRRCRHRRTTIRTGPSPMVVPFPAGGLTDVPTRLAATMLQEKIGQPVVIENRTGGSGTIGATYAARADAGRLHAVRQFARAMRRTCTTCRSPTIRSTISPRSAGSSTGRRWCWSSTPSCRSRRSPSWLRPPRPIPTRYSFGTSGPASSPNATLVQFNAAGRNQDHRGAVSRLRRSRHRRRHRRHPGRRSHSTPRASAGRHRQDSGARDRRPEADRGLAGRSDPPRARLQDRSARLRRACRAGEDAEADRRLPQQGISTRWCRPRQFKKPMAELGMAPPPPSENTPEKFDAYMRHEIERQGEYAKLSGLPLHTPQRRRYCFGMPACSTVAVQVASSRATRSRISSRRAGGRLAAEADQPRAHLGHGERLAHLGVEPRQHRLGQSGRRRPARTRCGRHSP